MTKRLYLKELEKYGVHGTFGIRCVLCERRIAKCTRIDEFGREYIGGDFFTETRDKLVFYHSKCKKQNYSLFIKILNTAPDQIGSMREVGMVKI